MTDFIRSGKLRALAVTTASRAEVLPDLPTLGEFVPGYEASQWYGLGAPKGTPAEIVDKHNKEINAALSDTRMKMRFADIGSSSRTKRRSGASWSERPTSSRSDAGPPA
jgi:tripartite-type tricarboxylate transporter receptor subunit TctC